MPGQRDRWRAHLAGSNQPSGKLVCGGLGTAEHEFQCGQWLVNRHADGEGRVFYELGNCGIPTSLRSRIEQGNERIDEARSLVSMDRATESVAENVRIIGSYVRAQKQAKGVGQATRNIYRCLYR